MHAADTKHFYICKYYFIKAEINISVKERNAVWRAEDIQIQFIWFQ